MADERRGTVADKSGKRSGLDTALAVWSRRRWLAVAGFVLPLTAGVSVITFLPNMYRSTATVLVDRQQIPETFVRSTVTSALETRLHTISQEHRVSEFKRRHLGVLPQQLETNRGTLARLYTQLRLNADNQPRAAERRQSLSSQLAEAESLLSMPLSPTAVMGTAAETPEARLIRLKEELVRLRLQFSEKYPDVVRTAAEVQVLERQLDAAKSQEKRPEAKPPAAFQAPLTPYVLRLKEALGDVDADIKVYKGEEQRLRDGIAAYQARVENVPRREQEFRELSRDYESTRELYQSLLKRFEEAQLSESMEQRQEGEQFRVLDPALAGRTPVAANRFQLLVKAMVVSLAVAAGALVLAERADKSFHTVDDLRAPSAVPVLVSIPRIMTPRDRRRRQWRMGVAAGAALFGLVLVVGIAHYVAHGNEHLVWLLAGRGGA